jgi:hypothetical protein
MRPEAIARVLVALAAAIAWIGCSSAALERLRRHTYPPTFNYITEDQLKSTMWELASHTNQLDRLLHRSEAGLPASALALPEPPSAVARPPDSVPPAGDAAPRSQAGGETLQQRVVFQLTEIDRVAKALGPGDWPSNHPQVSRNVEQFRQDIEAARHAAELEPPDYLLAGSVTEVCIRCHDAN